MPTSAASLLLCATVFFREKPPMAKAAVCRSSRSTPFYSIQASERRKAGARLTSETGDLLPDVRRSLHDTSTVARGSCFCSAVPRGKLRSLTWHSHSGTTMCGCRRSLYTSKTTAGHRQASACCACVVRSFSPTSLSSSRWYAATLRGTLSWISPVFPTSILQASERW